MSRSSRASWTAGLHQESVDTAFRADVRLLDEALDSLFELLPTGMTASHIAAAFARTGAAARALSSWIKRTGDGGVPIATAVGTKLPPPVLPSAIALLAQCEPPNDHALYGFIAANAPQLDGIQRDAVLRLATWPVRSPSGLTDVLGWVAWKAFPEAVAIRQMWTRWIHHGCFDGKPRSPQELARFLVDAEREELAGRDAVEEALRSHVRGELQSGERDRVVGALDHVEAAADVGAAVLGTLLREADGVAGTAEWDRWRERDAETAEWTEWYAFHVVREARGGRDWLRALREAEQMVLFARERRRLLGRTHRWPTEVTHELAPRLSVPWLPLASDCHA